jgi:hypothetical protein
VGRFTLAALCLGCLVVASGAFLVVDPGEADSSSVTVNTSAPPAELGAAAVRKLTAARYRYTVRVGDGQGAANRTASGAVDNRNRRYRFRQYDQTGATPRVDPVTTSYYGNDAFGWSRFGSEDWQPDGELEYDRAVANPVSRPTALAAAEATATRNESHVRVTVRTPDTIRRVVMLPADPTDPTLTLHVGRRCRCLDRATVAYTQDGTRTRVHYLFDRSGAVNVERPDGIGLSIREFLADLTHLEG